MSLQLSKHENVVVHFILHSLLQLIYFSDSNEQTYCNFTSHIFNTCCEQKTSLYTKLYKHQVIIVIELTLCTVTVVQHAPGFLKRCTGIPWLLFCSTGCSTRCSTGFSAICIMQILYAVKGIHFLYGTFHVQDNSKCFT